MNGALILVWFAALAFAFVKMNERQRESSLVLIWLVLLVPTVLTILKFVFF